MTRTEFNENVSWFGELSEICSEYGCDIMDDVYSPDAMDEAICESIREASTRRPWYDIKDLLSGIDYDGDDVYYRRDGEWDWVYLSDDDFYEYRDSVEQWMEENDYFDPEDDEEEEEEESIPEYPAPSEPVEEPEIENEPIGIAELFTAANSTLQMLRFEPEQEEKQEENFDLVF